VRGASGGRECREDGEYGSTRGPGGRDNLDVGEYEIMGRSKGSGGKDRRDWEARRMRGSE
jgi:hypothetical protein